MKRVYHTFIVREMSLLKLTISLNLQNRILFSVMCFFFFFGREGDIEETMFSHQYNELCCGFSCIRSHGLQEYSKGPVQNSVMKGIAHSWKNGMNEREFVQENISQGYIECPDHSISSVT